MPVITSTPYDLELNTIQYMLYPDHYNLCVDVNNGSYSSITDYVQHGGNLYGSVDWEFAFTLPPGSGFSSNKPMTAIFYGEGTLIHALVEQGRTDVVDALAEYNVDFNQYGTFSGSYNGLTPTDGTPLHIACASNNWDLAEKLLDNGALPNILNSSNETPIDTAINYGYGDLAENVIHYAKDHDLDITQSIAFSAYVSTQGPLDLGDVLSDMGNVGDIADISIISDNHTAPASVSMIDSISATWNDFTGYVSSYFYGSPLSSLEQQSSAEQL